MIVSFAELAQYRGLVTLVDGAFDPLHPGHVAYFDAARGFGYPLVVNICPDRYTRTKHPILLPAGERAKLLDAFGSLRRIHVSEYDTVDVLTQLQPKYYVKGEDWRDRLPADQVAVCAQQQTTIAYVKTPRYSSTQLIRHLQPDVDVFERLVQGQRTPERWQPVTDYTEATRMPLERPQARVIAAAMGPSSVLDYGCGFGYLLHALREQLPEAQLIGYDPNMGTPGTVAGRIQMTPHEPCEWCDVVICREVLEHCRLVEWRRVVSRLCALTREFLYITTRFNPQPQHLLDVQLSDDLDPTHCTLPPQDLLRALIVLEGFRRRADLELQLDHQRQGRVLVYERGPHD